MSKVMDYRLSKDIEANYKPLNASDELLHIINAKIGDQNAINAIVNSQLRMIASMARAYASHKHSINDLFNEGVLGIMLAIPEFDVNSGLRFVTLAQHYVKNEIINRVYDDSLVRLPRNQSKMRDIAPKFDSNGNIIEEGFEKPKINSVSINAPVTDEENAPSFESFIVDTNNTPEQNTLENDLIAKIHSVLDKLNAYERKIVSMAFGFGDYEPMTFQEIGDSVGKSKQAVNIQLAKILERVKNPIINIM